MATEVEARLEARADNLAALDREALNKQRMVLLHVLTKCQ